MLVRQRAAAGTGSVGSVRAALGAAVLSLPSALLAMVGEALTQPWAADAKRAELRAWTVAQLRALCAQHGLRKAGAKAELVARLCAALCADASGNVSARASLLCAMTTMTIQGGSF